MLNARVGYLSGTIISKIHDTIVALVGLTFGWFSSGWISWNKHSPTMLRSVEKKILQYCKTVYKGFYVDVGPVVGPADKIWTISMNTDSTRTPLVLLHGLGAGVALWCLNLDYLAQSRPVYAIDLLGFGRSSRPHFSSDAVLAEQELVRSIEEWRKEMNMERFVLLGHSMGGFLAASYAISYPDRVKHLVLADPWGFPERPEQYQRPKEVPLWVRAVAYTLQPLNPLWAVRAAGPLGHWLINKTRSDITKKFSVFVKDENLITQYIYQCNSQQPSGESAFHAMMSGFGWAKHPMVNRIEKLDKDVPISLMYGSRSWVDNSAGEIIKEKRIKSEVNLHVIPGAGHHVYADKPELFNKLVSDACKLADAMPSKTLAIKASHDQSQDTTDSEITITDDMPNLTTKA